MRGAFFHECAVCGERKHCHHRDLDFRGGVVCDDCAMPVVHAERLLLAFHLLAPIDRALDAK